MQEWRIVPGTDNKIEVSNMGQVRSLLRGEPYVLKTQTDAKGYARIRVTVNRNKLSYKVHRIVAQAFIPNPDNLPQVNHINGDKSDNRVCNLEWMSNRDNARHAIENGLWDTVIAGSIRENNSRKKPVIATKDDARIIFESVSEAERYFNSRHISDVLKGKRQSVKGWSFSYKRGGDHYGA